MRISVRIGMFAALLIMVFTVHAYAAGGADKQKDCFSNSLHKTGEGMRYWYEAEDGFMSVTGVPYKELGCKNCHVSSCNDCHQKEEGEICTYSVETARDKETCFKCHARAKATVALDGAKNTPDVHIGAGMDCAECHSLKEIHGDGKQYSSMRQPGAMETKCANCHSTESKEYPAVPATRSHTVHKGQLTCNACHVRNSMSCYNCHFGEFKKTGKKAESFVGKTKDFLLLVKHDGKITSGTIQTLVGFKNEPFVVYAPYFTHSVMEEGRKCEACHATEAVMDIAAEKPFSPVSFTNDKPDFYNGVVPVVPDYLNWLFFEKKEGKWTPFTPKTPPAVQMGLYAEPFTDADLNKLKKQQKYSQ